MKEAVVFGVGCIIGEAIVVLLLLHKSKGYSFRNFMLFSLWPAFRKKRRKEGQTTIKKVWGYAHLPAPVDTKNTTHKKVALN